MAEMRSLLSFMEKDDRERALARFEELFDQAGPDREEALIAALGTALRQVVALEREYRAAQSNGIVPFSEPMRLPEGLGSEPEAPAEKSVAAAEPESVPATEPEAETPPKKRDENPSATETAAPENDVIETPAGSFVRAAASVLEESDTSAEQMWEAISSMDEGFPLESLIPPGEPPLKTDAIVFPEVVYGLPEEETPAAETPADAGELPPEAPSETPAVMPEPSIPEKQLSQAEPEPEIRNAEAAEEAEPKAVKRTVPPKQDLSPGAGRIFAAVLVTFPFIVIWLVSFAVSIALGLAVMALGFAFCAAGIYLIGYLRGGGIDFMPDLLLIGGGVLVCFGLALLFIWMGLWIAVGGCASAIRWTGSIYRKILRRKVPRKGGAQ